MLLFFSNLTSSIIHGYAVPASNFKLEVISKTDMNVNHILPKILSSDNVNVKVIAGTKKKATPQSSEHYKLKITFFHRFILLADENTYSIRFSVQNNGFQVYGGDDWECQISTKIIQGTFQDEPMVGFVEISRRHYDHCPLPKRKSLLCIQETSIRSKMRKIF